MSKNEKDKAFVQTAYDGIGIVDSSLNEGMQNLLQRRRILGGQDFQQSAADQGCDEGKVGSLQCQSLQSVVFVVDSRRRSRQGVEYGRDDGPKRLR